MEWNSSDMFAKILNLNLKSDRIELKTFIYVFNIFFPCKYNYLGQQVIFITSLAEQILKTSKLNF